MHDALYFGSVRVHLQHVAGEVVPFRASEWIEDDKTIELVFARGTLRSSRDNRHVNVVEPAIPALDITANPAVRDSEKVCSLLPALLRVPLKKTRKDQNDVLQHVCAVASGVRSALVKVGADFYRLKGCGNRDEGFVVRDNKTWRDIRGAAFPHTALRELFMTAHIDSLAKSEGCVACNEPIAVAYYEEEPLGPEFPIACAIERTRGDRRLGSHVLAGLQLMLPLLVRCGDSAFDEQALMRAFPSTRPRDSLNSSIPAVTGDLMTDYELATSPSGSERDGCGLHWPDVKRDASLFANFNDAAFWLPETAPPSNEFPIQWTRAGPQKMTSDFWQSAWKRCVDEYASALAEIQKQTGGKSNVLAYLFSRIGWECGHFLRVLHDARICWGTYQDLMCRRDLDEWHCNAHANNFVLLPEGSSDRFTSYLDLDMAFDEKSFVDVVGRKVGISTAEFDHLLWRENVNLMECLCGSDRSNGVPGVALSWIEKQDNRVRTISSGLYDALMLGYLNAYAKDTNAYVAKQDKLMDHAAHCVLRLAVITMSEFEA